MKTIFYSLLLARFWLPRSGAPRNWLCFTKKVKKSWVRMLTIPNLVSARVFYFCPRITFPRFFAPKLLLVLAILWGGGGGGGEKRKKVLEFSKNKNNNCCSVLRPKVRGEKSRAPNCETRSSWAFKITFKISLFVFWFLNGKTERNRESGLNSFSLEYKSQISHSKKNCTNTTFFLPRYPIAHQQIQIIVSKYRNLVTDIK